MSTPLVLIPQHHATMMNIDTTLVTMDYTDAYYCESPTQHNSQFAMQKYLLLQNQHETLRQHMHELCPTYSNTPSSKSVSPSSSICTSPIRSKHTSPTRHHQRSGRKTSLSSAPASRSTSRSCSNPSLPPVLDEELIIEMAAEEQKLCDVNEGIKRALTELLNCDTVRKDRTMRTWVQSRLLDTERELRTGRRRRSNGSTD